MRRLWHTSVGKKLAVAGSGAVLLAYVVLHMVGNLNSLYGAGQGEARVDGYAHWLREFGQPILPYATLLWAIRVLLLAALAIHVTAIVQLRARNRAARPRAHRPRRQNRGLSARTMLISGPFLLAFVIFHILQFTTLTIDVTPLREGAVYANLYGAFQKWWLVAIYLLAIGALALHLRHAIWSAAQTLGLDRPDRTRTIRAAATATTVALGIGFASVPLAFWTGILGRPR